MLNVYRRRLDYPDLKTAVREQKAFFNATVILIEDKSSGTALIQELTREGVHGIQPYKPEGDKVMHMNAQTGTIQSGFVYIPHQAHWLPDYLEEITTYPASKYSDQIDSTSQALDWYKKVPNFGLEEMKRIFTPRGRLPRTLPIKVRLKAPPDGATDFYIGSRRGMLDEDGTTEFSEEEAVVQIRNGWKIVPA